MDEVTKERLVRLCESAAKEQDPTKLLAFVTEINRLLDEKERRLKSRKASIPDSQTGQDK